MHHSDILREIMILNDVTQAALAKKLGMSKTGVLHLLDTKTGGIKTVLQALTAMNYEIVLRPRTNGTLPEGEYVPRPMDYSYDGEDDL